ncbi:hypothetical protein E2C01_040107 [Portunus trituberculatus]|uniref:Uncharacterized protein n=1 Tax=Portunus trituberculatus TaxID=210409 RepID=A0A5B7FLK4_PORTR|nr:hypothetical protein [Portunus trituberculatus]
MRVVLVIVMIQHVEETEEQQKKAPYEATETAWQEHTATAPAGKRGVTQGSEAGLPACASPSPWHQNTRRPSNKGERRHYKALPASGSGRID